MKISKGGKVETVLKSEKPWSPTGVVVRGKDVFVLEYTNTDQAMDWVPRVRKLRADGKVAILADMTREKKNKGDDGALGCPAHPASVWVARSDRGRRLAGGGHGADGRNHAGRVDRH